MSNVPFFKYRSNTPPKSVSTLSHTEIRTITDKGMSFPSKSRQMQLNLRQKLISA